MSAVNDRVALFLEGTPHNRREILTPEGVVLPIDLADHGERAVALIVDLLIWLCVTALLFVTIIAFVVQGVAVEIATTLILFLAFIVRNLYFVYFELAWQGATPGKWVSGLRVIDRRGGPLTPSAVFARNLTREVEIFLPLGLFFSVPNLDAGAGFWTAATYFGWSVAVSALPLFNRDHLRAGMCRDVDGGLAEGGRRTPDDQGLPFLDLQVAEEAGPGGRECFGQRGKVRPGQVTDTIFSPAVHNSTHLVSQPTSLRACKPAVPAGPGPQHDRG